MRARKAAGRINHLIHARTSFSVRCASDRDRSEPARVRARTCTCRAVAI